MRQSIVRQFIDTQKRFHDEFNYDTDDRVVLNYYIDVRAYEILFPKMGWESQIGLVEEEVRWCEYKLYGYIKNILDVMEIKVIERANEAYDDKGYRDYTKRLNVRKIDPQDRLDTLKRLSIS